MTDGVRTTYLDAADVAVDLLKRPGVERRWDDDSALPKMTVGSLAGHVARAGILQVEAGLDGPEPAGDLIDAVAYYAGLTGLTDVDSELSQGVRERSEEAAADGYRSLLQQAESCLGRLRDRLPDEPATRALEAFGIPLTLDQYLRTRIVELVVHADDLAVSVGVDVLAPDAAMASAIESAMAVAEARHGRLAVVRALTRTERDEVNALRVF